MPEETRESEGYKCPYCGYQTMCDDWGFDYDEKEVECDECGKKYYATADHEVTFEATPSCKLNKEDCEFKHAQHRDGSCKRFDCVNCDDSIYESIDCPGHKEKYYKMLEKGA